MYVRLYYTLSLSLYIYIYIYIYSQNFLDALLQKREVVNMCAFRQPRAQVSAAHMLTTTVLSRDANYHPG